MLARFTTAALAAALFAAVPVAAPPPALAGTRSAWEVHSVGTGTDVHRPIELWGQLRPGARRPYVLQERVEGTWKPLRSGRTDSQGWARNVRVRRTTVGVCKVRFVARASLGYRRAVSRPLTCTVWQGSTATAAIAGTQTTASGMRWAPLGSTVTITGAVTPAVAGRAVKVTNPAGGFAVTVRSAADGTFSVSSTLAVPGQNNFHVEVAGTRFYGSTRATTDMLVFVADPAAAPGQPGYLHPGYPPPGS